MPHIDKNGKVLFTEPSCFVSTMKSSIFSYFISSLKMLVANPPTTQKKAVFSLLIASPPQSSNDGMEPRPIRAKMAAKMDADSSQRAVM